MHPLALHSRQVVTSVAAGVQWKSGRGTSTSNAHVIQIPAAGYPGAVTVRQVASMTTARGFCNSVVLPDGKVAVFGGQVSVIKERSSTKLDRRSSSGAGFA